MPAIPGTNVAAMVVPFDELDIYATHNDKYGRGGYRVCDLLADRNAISDLRRKAGMWVRVLEDGKLYELGNDLLTWTEVTLGGAASTPGDLTLEAGENIAIGTPVKVTANLVYAASNLTDPLVVGIARASALSGFLVTICTSGPVTLTGLTPNTPYFLGSGVIAAAPPVAGYVTRLGNAVSSTTLIVNIEEPILLA
jgi:hypothetical protein